MHLRRRPTDDGLSLEKVAEETEGFVASDLKLLVEEASREAMYEDEKVDNQHLLDAIDRVE